MAVVVGFIPTPVGFDALDTARAQAESRGGPLIVLNVVHSNDEDDPRHASDGDLDAAADRLRGSAVRVDIRQETSDEDISDVLLDTVEKEKAELLVIGLRRERDVARHLLGITPQKLLLSAPCDVLVV
ncbi:universal stress protein [Brachybacterium endophyticum]|uniref:Universal stress protein n=1 Tax=Brachybacterium endophyticum TaxID=2182385 RepID=A0A2U2RL66_9MICO|nr:universal stress protein [Brachybacterium endophyticum]PWH06619.1 universal stress protein [Brachybacterium endophyticum]